MLHVSGLHDDESDDFQRKLNQKQRYICIKTIVQCYLEHSQPYFKYRKFETAQSKTKCVENAFTKVFLELGRKNSKGFPDPSSQLGVFNLKRRVPMALKGLLLTSLKPNTHVSAGNFSTLLITSKLIQNVMLCDTQ